MFESNEVVELLKDIRDFLSNIEDQIDSIKMECQEINSKLGDINGAGIYDMTDVCEKLDSIETAIDNITL